MAIQKWVRYGDYETLPDGSEVQVEIRCPLIDHTPEKAAIAASLVQTAIRATRTQVNLKEAES